MNSISIAICDDMAEWRHIISSRIQNIINAQNLKSDIHLFAKCEEIDAALSSEAYFDIYILDIEMKSNEMDGIRLGHLIREKYKHDDSLILYSSFYTKYYAELFDIHPFNFIMKSLKSDDFNYKVLTAINRIIKGREMFTIKSGGTHYFVRKTKILYLESMRKNIALTYRDFDSYKEIVYIGSLRSEATKLPPPDFFSPHTSFIVNFGQCLVASKNEVRMMNGKIIPVSRSKKNECSESFIKYMAYLD